jgi:hypothetical protein
MARMLAGFRIVFKTVGIRVENGDEVSIKLDLQRSPAEFPRAIVYVGSKPQWGGVEMASIPAFATPEERVRVSVESPAVKEAGGEPTVFAAIMVEKQFDLDDALAARWSADADKAIEDVHRAIGEEVRTQLERPAVTLAAALGAYFSQGALAYRVWEGVFYYFTEKELKTVYGRKVIRVFDQRNVTKESLQGVLANSIFVLLPDRIFPVSKLLERVGLAAHWMIVASGEQSPTNRFMAHFLVLEILSRLAPDLPAPDSLSSQWVDRERDFKELCRLAESTSTPTFLQRVAKRLAEIQYSEPSLAEGFKRFVDLHPGEMKDADKQVFRRAIQIRNNLIHGRISEPPSILEPDSPTSALEDLAVSAMKAILASVARMPPGSTVQL